MHQLEVVAAIHSGAEVRERVDAAAIGTLRQLSRSVEERVGERIALWLFTGDGVPLPADDTPLTALPANSIVRVRTRARVHRVEPLWGPDHGGTTCNIVGVGFSALSNAAARVQFGAVSVPCEFVSDTCLRVRTPAHPIGLVRVRLLRCENDNADEGADDLEDSGSFEFIRLENAWDRVFATTNSFCPVRRSDADEECCNAAHAKDDDLRPP